jgi:hypothetical protein
MAEERSDREKAEDRLEACVGISVVFIATFLGICNVKDNNIVQQMQLKQGERNNLWAWFQARNIRAAVYEGCAEELSVPLPGETEEIKGFRSNKVSSFYKRINEQKVKMETQKTEAEALDAEVKLLGTMDDQFDLAEAALGIGLAMMGVTALIKRWWLFWISFTPSVFGFVMGIAGFLRMDTSSLGVDWMIRILT